MVDRQILEDIKQICEKYNINISILGRIWKFRNWGSDNETISRIINVPLPIINEYIKLVKEMDFYEKDLIYLYLPLIEKYELKKSKDKGIEIEKIFNYDPKWEEIWEFMGITDSTYNDN